MNQEYLCFMTDQDIMCTEDEQISVVAENAKEALLKAEPHFLKLGYSKTPRPFIYAKDGQEYHLINNGIWQMFWGIKTMVFPTAKKLQEVPSCRNLKKVFSAGENENDGASSWSLSIYDYEDQYLIVEDATDAYIIPKIDLDLDKIFENIKTAFDSKPRDLYICSMSDANIEYRGQKFTWPE